MYSDYFAPSGTLEIEGNSTNDIKETVLYPYMITLPIDKIQNNTAANQTTYISSGGTVDIGDFRWMEPQGNLTLSPSNEGNGMIQGTLVIEAQR